MSRMSDQIGRVLGGRYRLVAPIGIGASAQVFLADDVKLRRRVAVKMLHDALADDEAFLRRFRAEAQAAAALNHPNVMAVYDWGDDDVPFTRHRVPRRAAACGRCSTGARALTPVAGAAGRPRGRRGPSTTPTGAGFVHRDIKPANLLFGEEGRLRIADFGLARALAEAAWTEPQGAVLGTARYASPEQAQGEPLTGKADVYSLALVLIEAVTGEVPFAADTTIGTLMARVDRPLPVPDASSARCRASSPRPVVPMPPSASMPGRWPAACSPSPGTFPARGRCRWPVRWPPRPGSGGRSRPHPPPRRAGRRPGDDLRDDDLDLEPPAWVSSADGRHRRRATGRHRPTPTSR